MQIAEQNIKVRGKAESFSRGKLAQLKASWPEWKKAKENRKKIEWQIVKMKTVECTRNDTKNYLRPNEVFISLK